MGQVSLLYRVFKYFKAKCLRYYYENKNSIIFYLNGIEYQHGLSIVGPLYVYRGKNSEVKIGKSLHVTSGMGLNPLTRNIKSMFHIRQNAQLIIGDNVGISSSCIWANQSITIGNNVNIGGDTIIMDSDIHSLNYLDRRDPKTDSFSSKKIPIIIDNDVFIGSRCIILKGVHIGARSVIAAGSVVTKSIPEDCIAGGNPCMVINKSSKE